MKKRVIGFMAVLLVFALSSCPTDGDDSGVTDGGNIPVDVDVRPLSSTTMYISWIGVTNADYYTIYRVSDIGEEASFNVENAQDYTDTRLIPDTYYTYRVSATKSGVEGPKTQGIRKKTLKSGEQSPDAVTGVTATVSGSRVILTWDPQTGITKYTLERSTGENGPWSPLIEVAAPTATYTDQNLQAGVYYYHVAASNSGGMGLWSSPCGVTVQTGSSNTQYTVTFNADGGSPEPQTRQVTSGASIGSAGLPSAARSGYAFGGWYTERGGGGTQFTGGTVVTGDITVYAKWTVTIPSPAGLTVTGQTTDSISLSWQAVSGAEGYRVSRSANSGGPFNLVQTTTSTSYTDNGGLTPGTTYHYRVTAYNGQSESAAATTSGTTTTSGSGTIPLPPTKPAGLVVTDTGSGYVSLSWNSVTNADSYDIYRGNSKDGASAKLGNETGTSYTDNTVGAGALYYYSIRAVNSSGDSPHSNRAFAVAASHYTMPTYSSSYPVNLPAGSKHYYRLAVNAGQGYTITWQNGSSQNADWNIRCAAWQNDGTAIFSDAASGYTSPKVFTSAATGYITIEVTNIHSSAGFDYQIYY
jgi:uncharacterized repeat protein (TIGR02543 family)